MPGREEGGLNGSGGGETTWWTSRTWRTTPRHRGAAAARTLAMTATSSSSQTSPRRSANLHREPSFHASSLPLFSQHLTRAWGQAHSASGGGAGGRAGAASGRSGQAAVNAGQAAKEEEEEEEAPPSMDCTICLGVIRFLPHPARSTGAVFVAARHLRAGCGAQRRRLALNPHQLVAAFVPLCATLIDVSPPKGLFTRRGGVRTNAAPSAAPWREQAPPPRYAPEDFVSRLSVAVQGGGCAQS